MADSTPLDMDSPVDGMPIARNDGGPAFPIEGWPESAAAHSGMTLRDYFAAKALPFVIGWTTVSSVPQNLAFDATAAAKAAYALADAMLKERDKIGGAS